MIPNNKNNFWLIITLLLGYILNIATLNLSHYISDNFLDHFSLNHNLRNQILTNIVNYQHLGILLGCVFFGIYADKKGRLAALFLSIFLYSFFTILSTTVKNLNIFYVLKFLTGFCLSGEFGIIMLLLIEAFSGKSRNLMIIAFGILAPFSMVATRILMLKLEWEEAYIVVALLGFVLIFLRITTFESDLFKYIKNETERKQNYLKQLFSRSHIKVFILNLFLIFPIFSFYGFNVKYGTGLSTLIGESFNIDKTSIFIFIFYLIGAIMLIFISSFFKNRKVGIISFLIISLLINVICLFTQFHLKNYYIFIMLHIISISYIYEYFQFAAENLNMYLRGTAIGTLAGLGRGSVIVIIYLIELNDSINIVKHENFPFYIQIILVIFALLAISQLKNNYKYNNDLLSDGTNFKEKNSF